MKAEFFTRIMELMETDERLYFLSGGLGWPRTDELQSRFPKRFLQCEASEQTMLDIAVGLAYSKKIVFTYTITPFYLRAYETIRTYIDHENLPVVMIGAGRDDDYSKDDGFSHDAQDIDELLYPLKNIKTYYPHSKEQIKGLLQTIIADPHPAFISLTR